MTIGQLARRVGIRPSAIRYYEALGVLRAPARSAAEYRLYGPEAVALLRFIRSAKELGFSLDEARQIIAASRKEPPCALSRTLMERRLAQVESELGRLRSVRDRLKKLLREPASESTGGVCPLIEDAAISSRTRAAGSPAAAGPARERPQ